MIKRDELIKLLKQLPPDAQEIRVAALWRKDLGDFDYVSFIDPSRDWKPMKSWPWEIATVQKETAGTVWIQRLVKEKKS